MISGQYSGITNKQRTEPIWESIGRGQLGQSATTAVFRLSVNENRPHLAIAKRNLTGEELERAYRFRQPEDQLRFVLGRSTLREILGFYTGQSPRQVPLDYNTFGKPLLNIKECNQLYFNVSHSGDNILIATGKVAIGIDTEQLVTSFAYEEMIPDVFSTAEADAIAQAEHPDAYFYLLWTRKEALLKNIGCGLSYPVKEIPVLDGSHTVTFDPKQLYETCSFFYSKRYVASICTARTPSHPIRFYHVRL